MSQHILVIGSLNMDYVTHVDHMPVAGETITGSQPAHIPGGKGANQAVAIGKLGGRVVMRGCVGEDAFGDELLANLTANNVNSLVTQHPIAPTGVALIYIDESGDNAIVVIEGANGTLLPEDIEPAWFDNASHVIIQCEIPVPTIGAIIQGAHDADVPVIFNPAPVKPFDLEWLQRVDTLVVNETECEALFGSLPADEPDLRAIATTFGLTNVLLTLGSNGSVYLSPTDYIAVPAQRVEVVDTTGAGDSFIGAFVTRLAAGDTPYDALHYATRVAAITVTRLGAQQSIPTKDELDYA